MISPSENFADIKGDRFRFHLQALLKTRICQLCRSKVISFEALHVDSIITIRLYANQQYRIDYSLYNYI